MSNLSFPLVAAVLFAAAFTVSGPVRAEDGASAALAAEARGVVKTFAAALSTELKAGIEAGGPVAAIEVCNLKAPALAEQASRTSGWRVGRTAQRLRNPKNAPDAWEQAGLAAFAATAATGADLTKLERFETVQQDGHPVFRYMKAIPTAELCVTCHGAALKPEVQARLAELYPTDQARGFAVGDLRGAFTLTKPLD
jgi:hypothetical protein